MKPRAITPIIALALALAVASAGTAQPPRSAVGIDPSQGFQVLGTAVAVSVGFGQGMPTITVDDAALGILDVRLGPVWYLQQQGFAIAPGDEVELLAYPCTVCSIRAVAAWITDLASGETVELRDDEGYPLWTATGGHGPTDPRCWSGQGDAAGRHQGSGPPAGDEADDADGEPGAMGPGGNGPMIGYGWEGPGRDDDRGFGGQCAWGAPDMASVTTVTGTVTRVEVFGGSPPVVDLAGPDGEIELLLMPFGPVAAAGLLLDEGDELTATYAPWTWGDEELLVVIALTDTASGVTVQLRDPETGLPLGSGHGRW